jgi:hypothetical protein
MKIRAYVDMDEVNKIRFYKDFIVVDDVPVVGGIFGLEEIKEVSPVRLDPEQGRDEVWNYDYYHVFTTMNNEWNKEEECYEEEFLCCKKTTLRVELHYWTEGSGYSHSETFDEVPEGFTAEQYVDEYNGDLIDEDRDYDAINVELYDKNNKLVSEYWLEKTVVYKAEQKYDTGNWYEDGSIAWDITGEFESNDINEIFKQIIRWEDDTPDCQFKDFHIFVNGIELNDWLYSDGIKDKWEYWSDNEMEEFKIQLKRENLKDFSANDAVLRDWCGDSADSFEQYDDDGNKITYTEEEWLKIFQETRDAADSEDDDIKSGYTIEAIDKMTLLILEEDGFVK